MDARLGIICLLTLTFFSCETSDKDAVYKNELARLLTLENKHYKEWILVNMRDNIHHSDSLYSEVNQLFTFYDTLLVTLNDSIIYPEVLSTFFSKSDMLRKEFYNVDYIDSLEFEIQGHARQDDLQQYHLSLLLYFNTLFKDLHRYVQSWDFCGYSPYKILFLPKNESMLDSPVFGFSYHFVYEEPNFSFDRIYIGKVDPSYHSFGDSTYFKNSLLNPYLPDRPPLLELDTMIELESGQKSVHIPSSYPNRIEGLFRQKFANGFQYIPFEYVKYRGGMVKYSIRP